MLIEVFRTYEMVRFVAEHGAEVDVEDLTEGRELLIDELRNCNTYHRIYLCE